MKTEFCSVIVMSNATPRIVKLHVSRIALAIIAAAGLSSFLLTVSIGYYFPATLFNQTDPAYLQRDNHTLRIDNMNTELQTQRLNAQVSNLEERSNRMVELIETE